MFLNLSALANICISLPVSTASVEQSFSQMKMIKVRLRNRIGESSLNHLMLIVIESVNHLTNSVIMNLTVLLYCKCVHGMKNLGEWLYRRDQIF